MGKEVAREKMTCAEFMYHWNNGGDRETCLRLLEHSFQCPYCAEITEAWHSISPSDGKESDNPLTEEECLRLLPSFEAGLENKK